MMPWTVYLGPALRRLFKKRDPFRDALQFCLVWAGFIFLFFSLSKTQLVTYIAPMFPPTAYLIGWYWYRSYIERSFPRALLAASYILGILLLACNALPLSRAQLSSDPPSPGYRQGLRPPSFYRRIFYGAAASGWPSSSLPPRWSVFPGPYSDMSSHS